MELKNKKSLEFSSKLELLTFVFQKKLEEILELDPNILQITVLKIDCNYHKIMIKTQKNKEIQIKILQILDAVSIFMTYFDMDSSRFCSIKLNLNNYLTPQLRNTYKIENIENYFKKREKIKMLDLFEIRIINKIVKKPPKKLNFIDITESLFLKICLFLDYKSLYALMFVSNELYLRFFNKNEFWNRLYQLRFKKTGFKLNLVLWKEAYFNKLKEKKSIFY